MKDQQGELEQKTEELITRMENLHLAEYVDVLQNPKRLWRLNFFAGIARGLGMAVGFTLLGAMVLYLLQKLVTFNLPVIGDFIAEIVRIVLERY